MARSRRPRAQAPAQRLILDAGAVIAWARGDVRMRALLTRALEAVRAGANVITSDADDLRALLADQPRVTVIPLEQGES